MPDEVIEQAAAPASAPAASPAPAPAASAPAASPAAAPAASPPASPAAAPAASPAPAPVANKWSDTWREDMAGTLADDASDEDKADHTKLLARLKRFNTPADAAKALRQQDKLISSGQVKKALAANAKPEEIAAWRKENGIPETADKYDTGLKGDELLPMGQKLLSLITEKAHEANVAPEAVKAMASALPAFQQLMAEEAEKVNSTAKAEAIETLRADWGPDYKSNMDGMLSMLNSFPSAASEALINARVDGVQILNIPEVARALAGHARELGYVGATVVPSGGDIGKSIEDEIASIEKSMFNENGTKNPAYWNSDKAIDRYSQLLEAKKRRESK